MKQSNEFIVLHVRLGRISLILIAGVLAITAVLAYRAALPARAAGPWYVTPGGNDGNSCLSPASPCATINGAIGKASSDDTIYVATGTYTSSSGNEVVLIDRDITLSGGWNQSFTSQEETSIIDGQGSRVGVFLYSVKAAIDHFTVQHGGGGGIHVQEANLSIADSIIINNVADMGGGISDSNSVITMTHTVISENHAEIGGGGIYNINGKLIATDSTIAGNTVGVPVINPTGAGIWSSDPGSQTILNRVTISGNRSRTALNPGEAVVSGHWMEMINSTISNNDGNGITISGDASIRSSTIADNTGIGLTQDNGQLEIMNTILANNGGMPHTDCYCKGGDFVDLGYNLILTNYSCLLAPTDLNSISPLLASLADYGGLTLTRALSRSSPAIDAGDPAGCTDYLGNPLDTDQRGVARVGRCDIGSYEYDPANDPLRYLNLPLVLRNSCPDFFDNFSNPTSGWFVGETNALRAEYLNGEYRVLVKQAGSTFVFRAPTCNRQNYILEVDGRWGGNPGASYGLIFGIVGDFEQFYTLEVSPDVRGLALYRYVSGTWSEIWSHTDLAFIWDENQLKLTRNGDAINLVVNGTTIVETFYDNTITGMTGVGLIVSSFSDLANADARFDNFSVSKLNGPVTAGNRQNGNAGSAEPQASFRMLENAESAELERQSPERVGGH